LKRKSPFIHQSDRFERAPDEATLRVHIYAGDPQLLTSVTYKVALGKFAEKAKRKRR